VNALQKNQFET